MIDGDLWWLESGFWTLKRGSEAGSSEGFRERRKKWGLRA